MIAVNAISGGIRRIGMARKNNMKPDNASSIHFDTRTKAVMAQVNSEDKVNVKEKVSAVREVVPGKSANEIVLVLQFYDYNVERAIQAYLEDGAKEALTEWHFTGNKVPNKKKKNKKNKSSGAQSGATASASASASLSSAPTQASDKPAVLNHTKEPLANGDLHEDEELLRERARLLDGDTSHTRPSSSTLKPKPASAPKQTSTPTAKAAPTPPPQAAAAASADQSTSRGGGGEAPPHHNRQHHNKHSDKHSGSHHHGHHDHQRQRTISERSTSSITSEGVKKPFAGLEKSTKDLQRQTISLERLRLGLDAEIEKAYKRIKTVFDEARDNLMDREVQLMREMDALKVQAHEVFQMRHDKAGELRVQVDRSEKLNPSQLAELRADIKLFVSDRKIDEDLCKTTRFTYDSDHFFEEIKNFGTVVPVKCPYNTRRPSVSSVASSGHGQEDPVSPSRLKKHTPNFSMHSDVKPVGDNSNLSVSEMAELNQRLKNSLQLQGLPVKSPPQRNRPASAPAQKPEGEQREGDFRKNRSGRRRRGPRENSQGENASNPTENHTTTSNTAQSGRQSSSPEKKANSRSPRRNYSGNQSSPRRYGSAGSGGRGQRSEGHDEESGYRGDGQRPRGRGEGRGRGGRGREGRGRGQGRGGRGGGNSNPPPQSSPDGSTSVNHVVNGSTKGPE